MPGADSCLIATLLLHCFGHACNDRCHRSFLRSPASYRKARPLVISHSPTLAINEELSARRARGEQVVHLGFGEAGLPVLPEVAAALAGAVQHNGYGPVGGSASAREAVAGYFDRRGLATTPEQVLLAPGSKALLYGTLAAVAGDVVLPVPSWVSYAAQAALTGKRVVPVPVPERSGGLPDPLLLEDALQAARAQGADPRILVVTLPDNPTGTRADASLVGRLCEVAERHRLLVISDEIYRDLAYQPEDHCSPAALRPRGTVVTTGLSKSMALGGWRIGFARLPDGPVGEQLLGSLTGVASEVWSSLAAPMQAAARYVMDEPPEVLAHLAASRRLHQAVATEVHAVLTGAGAACRPPTAAFYLYPDLERLRPHLEARGITGGADLAAHLLAEHGVGVLAGEHFGDDPAAYRFRVATSLLYGSTEEERWRALRAADPTALPWVAQSLARLRQALAALAPG